MKPTPSQQLAIDMQGCTLLISAAAGSGKTATLTKRIITKLLGDGETPGADLSRILVVTFTKAAAAELKSRIGSALTEAIAEHPNNKHLSKQLLNLGNAKIRTIDSFYTEPVKTHFAELGIPPQLTLADAGDTAPLRQTIARELADQYYRRYQQADGNTFSDLINHVSPKKNLDHAGDVLLEIYTELTQDAGYTEKLKAAADEKKNDAVQKTPIFDTATGKLLKQYLTDCLTACIETLHKVVMRSMEIDTAPTPDYLAFEDDIRYYEDLRQKLTDITYNEIVAVWGEHKYAACGRKNQEQKTKEVEFLREVRDSVKDVFKKVKKDYLTFSEQEIHEQLAQEAQSLSLLSDWIADFDIAYRTAKEHNGICEFNDMRYYMMKLLLDKDGNPTEIAQELSGNYDEVYIDEYQDVDAAQDAVFAAIGGNHRFMVGDIKQCIYAFRGSRPDIFASYRQKMTMVNTPDAVPTDIGGSIFMSENFRCDKPIIDFTNLICDRLFPLCGESINYKPEDRLVCGKMQTGVTPQPVSVVLFPNEREEADSADTEDDTQADDCRAETAWVANEIETLLKTGKKDDGTAVRPQDIAVLARTGDPLAEMETELKKRGIPVLFDRNGLDATMVGETRFLLSVLQVIDNPENDTALEEVLAAVFSFSPLDLLDVRKKAAPKFSLFRALCLATDKDTAVSVETQDKCRRFLSWLRMQQHAEVNIGTDVFIRRLWQDEYLLPFTANDSAIIVYNDARKHQKNTVSGFHNYVSHLAREVEKNTLVPFKTDACAVNLLTEHKSKGLEYPVCFVIECGHSFIDHNSKRNFVWHSGKETNVGIKLFSRDPRTAMVTHVKSLDWRMAIAEKKKAEKQEEMRLLYVAMTRAREKLYLTGTITNNDKYQSKLEYATGGLLSLNRTIDWILSIVQGHENEATFVLTKPHENSTESGPAIPNTSNTPEQSAPPTTEQAPFAERYRAINEAWNTFVYQGENLQQIPNKLSASSATPNFIDTLLKQSGADVSDTDLAEWNNLSLHWMHDAEIALNGLTALNDAPKKASAAEKGTALHTFLQFCDWNAVAQNGTLAEIDRLVDQGYLADTDADMIDNDAINAVEKGDLMPLILASDEINREVKFHQNLPLANFTQNPELKNQYSNNTIFLQGSIDLLLTMKDGTLTLVDYKTDRILSEQNETPDAYAARITERHKMQLQLYADAIEQIYGQRPAQSYLYSISLKKLIPVSV